MRRTLLPYLMSFMLISLAQAMGPDPGGHTGQGVTPESTKTDRMEVDSARAKTEKQERAPEDTTVKSTNPPNRQAEKSR